MPYLSKDQKPAIPRCRKCGGIFVDGQLIIDWNYEPYHDICPTDSVRGAEAENAG
jgi:hypothetical protein